MGCRPRPPPVRRRAVSRSGKAEMPSSGRDRPRERPDRCGSRDRRVWPRPVAVGVLEVGRRSVTDDVVVGYDVTVVVDEPRSLPASLGTGGRIPEPEDANLRDRVDNRLVEVRKRRAVREGASIDLVRGVALDRVVGSRLQAASGDTGEPGARGREKERRSSRESSMTGNWTRPI